MTRLLLSLLSLLAIACPASAIENPSFERGSGNAAVGWGTDTQKGRYEFRIAGDARTGKRCAAIHGVEAGWARWFTTDVFLLAGARYRLSCWVRADAGAKGDVWLPGGSLTLPFQDVPQWTRVQGDLTVKNTGRHGLYLQNWGVGTVFFDDPAIELVAPAPAVGGGAIPTDGAPLVGIVIPDESDPAEGYLAVEAQRVLKEMTGTTLPILLRSGLPADSGSAAGRYLFIGRATDSKPYARDLARVGDEGIILDVTPHAVVCLGNTPRGTYYAVQELFYALGCRWYMPWPNGECIPHAGRLSLPPGKRVHRPSFELRGGKTIQVYHEPPEMTARHVNTEDWVDWAARNRMNGLKASYPETWNYGAIRGHEYAEFSGHTLYTVLPPDKYFSEHPEYYTLVKGKWTATHSSGRPSQVCVTNEEVIRHIADFINDYFDNHPDAGRFGVCAEDEPSYWCECERCKALDTAKGIDWSKNGEGCLDLTDRWIWFINRVAEKVEQKHPGKWVHTFAYGSTRELPRKCQPRKNVMIELTWWDRCFKHRMEDRSCAVNRKGMARLAGWSKLAPIAIYGYLEYHYWEMPAPFYHSDADFYRTVHRKGVRYVSDEWDTTHLASALLLNLRARLLWSVDTDVDRFVDDHCREVYGPAAEPVKGYLLGLERAVQNAPSEHVSFNDLEKFTPKVLAAAHHCLDQADRLAGSDEVLQARLARLRIALKFTEVCHLSKRVAAEPALYAPIGKLKTEVDALVRRYNIPILIQAYNELDMKYQPPVRAIAAPRVMQMPETWLFQPDPKGAGEGEKWFSRTDFPGWKPISIHSAWEGQGYPGMEGDGWYALRVKVPKVDAGRLYLLFEAVDETYKLWINGELAGQSEGDPGVLWDKPQAADITGKLRPGEENVIVVKVHDIGWAGGIWKPVWLTAEPPGQAPIGQE